MRLVLLFAFALTAGAQAGPAPREGWAIHETDFAYQELIDRLKEAVKAEDMFLVTEAGPTGAAKSRGIEIPGNRVLGVFRNDYAVRMLEASLAAGIEAPIRFYITEDEAGASLSYKTPGAVFAPYMEEGGEKLAKLAGELDSVFAAIAERAVAN